MDVPLITTVEFCIFLAFDGKLEANSDVEKELLKSAIDQFKEGINSLVTMTLFLFNSCAFSSWQIEFCATVKFSLILESFTSENKNDKARKCTYLALCKNLGFIR